MLTAEIDPELPTKVLLDGPYKYNDLIKTVPGTLFSMPKSADGAHKLRQAWRAPLSWQLCLALRTTFGEDLEIGPELRKWATEYRNKYIKPALERRMSTEEEIPGFEDLFGYQRAGVRFLATTRRAILTDGMGAGKTAQAISTLRYLSEVEGENVFPALVVAPNSTVLSWKREIERWWPGSDVTVLKGSATQRRKLLEQFNERESVCALHNVTPMRNTTLSGSVETATKKISGNETRTSPKSSEKMQETGRETTPESLTPTAASPDTSSENSDLPQKSTKSGSPTQTIGASSAPGKQYVSTTTTSPEKSEESSVGSVIPLSLEEMRTSSGSTGQKCTCARRFLVMNWEGLRFHSRLAPYGNIALKRCEDCGGKDSKVKPNACQKHEKELNAIDFQSAIGDEIHRIKDGRTSTARALKAATDGTPVKIALSGTPIANTPGDLWSPLNWILPEAYPGRTAFVNRFLELAFNPWGGQEIIGLKQHMEPEFFAGVDPHLRHMPKDFVLSHLPPKVYERRDVEMGAKQAKAYKQMSEKLVAAMDDGTFLVTTDPMLQAGRLLQLSSTFGDVESWTEQVYNEKKGEWEEKLRQKLHLKDPSCKLDAFMDDLEDFGDESVVVFAVSSQLVNLLSARLEKQKIRHGIITGAVSTDERQRHIDDFQSGKTKIILVTCAAGGTGITLTKASIAVFLQRPWSLVESEQAEGRVHRIGSEIHDVIRIIDYVTVNTLEETVFPALEKKSGHLEKVLRSKEALRTMLVDNVLPEEVEE